MIGIKKVIDILEKFAMVGSVLTFTVMIVMGIVQVFDRFIPAFSIYFSEELARYTFVWAVFLASAICVRKRTHAAVELFVSWMPKKLQKSVLVISSIFSISFFTLIFIKGIELTTITWSQASPAMEIPIGSVYLAIPVGGLLMLIFSIEAFYLEFTDSPQQQKDEQGEVL